MNIKVFLKYSFLSVLRSVNAVSPVGTSHCILCLVCPAYSQFVSPNGRWGYVTLDR